MEKQIFVPKSYIDNMLDDMIYIFNAYVNGDYFTENGKEYNSLLIIGIVNKHLGNKANCKQIVSVVYRPKAVNEQDETLIEGYLISYLESEMQFTKSNIVYYRMVAEDLIAENSK